MKDFDIEGVVDVEGTRMAIAEAEAKGVGNIIAAIIDMSNVPEILRSHSGKKSKILHALATAVKQLPAAGEGRVVELANEFSIRTASKYLRQLQAAGIGQGLEVLPQKCGEGKLKMCLVPVATSSALHGN